MSYLAIGNGKIIFNGVLTDAELGDIKMRLSPYLQSDYYYTSNISSYKTKEGIAPSFSVLDVWSEFENYHGDDLIETLEYISNGNYDIAKGEIEYRGEDNTFWRLYYSSGIWKEENGRIVYGEEKTCIPLTEKTCLVAEPYGDKDYKEIYIGVEKDGVAWQTLCMAREKYHYDNMNIVHDHENYEVFVYENEEEDDYTKRFCIKEHKEEEK